MKSLSFFGPEVLPDESGRFIEDELPLVKIHLHHFAHKKPLETETCKHYANKRQTPPAWCYHIKLGKVICGIFHPISHDGSMGLVYLPT